MIRGVWSHATLGWVLAAALLPPVAAGLVLGGGDTALRLAAGLAAAAFWQGLFRAALGVPLSPSGAVTAVAVALLAPATLSLWQLAAGVAFGLVLADLVFGGWGRNVIGAPGVALAYLALAHPGTVPPAPEAAMALSSAASGAILLAFGLLSPRVALAATAAMAAVLALAGDGPAALAQGGAFAFALVFLLGDPVASAATPGGRWLYGALGGGLAGVFAVLGPGPLSPAPIVFAALLAQVFAPLLDHLALAAARAARSAHPVRRRRAAERRTRPSPERSAEHG